MKIQRSARFAPLVGVLLCFAGASGCANAVRSDAVKQLVGEEEKALDRLTTQLGQQQAKIENAVADLKRAHKGYITALKIWDKELSRASIIAASPGDLSNRVVRKAVMVKLAQLELKRNTAYTEVEKKFDEQADTIAAAYGKIVTAADNTKKGIGPVKRYVDEPTARFAIRSFDVATFKAAAQEFEKGKMLLARAAKLGKDIENSLGKAQILDRDKHLAELTRTLELLAARLKEFEAAD